MGLIKSPRQRRDHKTRSPALNKCPQKRGIVKKSLITTPRKPNSAKRKVAKTVIPSVKRTVDIYLEGMDFNRLNPHSVVLVRGKGPRDLPGVNYHAIRGKGDFPPLLNRRKGRSKYGAKQIKKMVEAKKDKFQQLHAEQLAAGNYSARRYLLLYGFKTHTGRGGVVKIKKF
jgi:small subunit ribosomal protein S12